MQNATERYQSAVHKQPATICNDNLIRDGAECCFFLHKEPNKGDEEHDCSCIVYTSAHDIVLKLAVTQHNTHNNISKSCSPSQSSCSSLSERCFLRRSVMTFTGSSGKQLLFGNSCDGSERARSDRANHLEPRTLSALFFMLK